jgi:hypothetical protein
MVGKPEVEPPSLCDEVRLHWANDLQRARDLALSVRQAARWRRICRYFRAASSSTYVNVSTASA